MDTMVQAVTLTLAEAATVLDPPVTEQQLRAMVTALGWKPSGWRRTGKAGRPVAAYGATRLLELHAAMVPFLGDNRLLFGLRPHALNRLRSQSYRHHGGHMFGIASIVAFAVALILQLASLSKGHVLTVATFVIIGLLCLAVHVVTGWWPARRSA